MAIHNCGGVNWREDVPASLFFTLEYLGYHPSQVNLKVMLFLANDNMLRTERRDESDELYVYCRDYAPNDWDIMYKDSAEFKAKYQAVADKCKCKGLLT